jgi:hypothetical protein
MPVPISPAVRGLSVTAGWIGISIGGVVAFVATGSIGLLAWLGGTGAVMLLLRNADPEHVCLCGRCASWHCRE